MGAKVILAGLSGISIALTIRSIFRVPVVWAGDYESYAMGATRFLRSEPLYAPFQLAGQYGLGDAAMGRGFVYPPPAVYLAIPFSLPGESVGFALFLALSAWALGAVAYAIAVKEGLGRSASGLVALLVLASGPAIESVATGQANTFVAAGLGLIWVRPRLSGYLAVLGALLKVFPGAGILWALRTRSPVVRPLAMGVVLSGASLLVQGPGLWADFLSSFRNGVSSSPVFPAAPRVVLAPLLGPTLSLAVILLLTVVLLVAVLRLRSERLAFGLLGLALILPAPDWYLHYLIIPLVGFLPLMLSRAVRLARRGRVPGPRPAHAAADTA